MCASRPSARRTDEQASPAGASVGSTDESPGHGDEPERESGPSVRDARAPVGATGEPERTTDTAIRDAGARVGATGAPLRASVASVGATGEAEDDTRPPLQRGAIITVPLPESVQETPWLSTAIPQGLACALACSVPHLLGDAPAASSGASCPWAWQVCAGSRGESELSGDRGESAANFRSDERLGHCRSD